MSIKIDEELCTGCGFCILACPEDAVDNRPSFLARINEELCTECLMCLDHCPNRALREE